MSVSFVAGQLPPVFLFILSSLLFGYAISCT